MVKINNNVFYDLVLMTKMFDLTRRWFERMNGNQNVMMMTRFRSGSTELIDTVGFQLALTWKYWKIFWCCLISKLLFATSVFSLTCHFVLAWWWVQLFEDFSVWEFAFRLVCLQLCQALTDTSVSRWSLFVSLNFS